MDWESNPPEVNIQSPPKLTRVVELDSSKFISSQLNRDKNGDHSEEEDEENDFSLPALAGEVADAQKLQALEINKRQDVLVELKKDYVKVQQKIELVKAEISGLGRKVCLTEEEVVTYENQRHERETGIDQLITSQRQLSCKIKNESQQLHKDKSKYDQYMDKMETHRLLVEEHESSNDARKEITNLENKTRKLREEICCLRNGQDQNVVGITEEYEILKTEISHLKRTNKDIEQEMEQRKLQIKSEVERQTKLKKETHLLQKRNHAQLTRLQRQLQEALGRSRHWNEEACKLETSIAQIREKIEE